MRTVTGDDLVIQEDANENLDVVTTQSLRSSSKSSSNDGSSIDGIDGVGCMEEK